MKRWLTMSRKSGNIVIVPGGRFRELFSLFGVKNLIIDCKQKTLGNRSSLISRQENRWTKLPSVFCCVWRSNNGLG